MKICGHRKRRDRPEASPIGQRESGGRKPPPNLTHQPRMKRRGK
jgi:hypothetical protein